MPSLRILNGGLRGAVFLPAQGSTSIGRLPSRDIMVDDPGVSRLHCSLEWDGRRVLLSDNASLHGTFVNGRRIREIALRAKDLIRIGSVGLLFDFRAAGDAPLCPRVRSHGPANERDTHRTLGPSPFDFHRFDTFLAVESPNESCHFLLRAGINLFGTGDEGDHSIDMPGAQGLLFAATLDERFLLISDIALPGGLNYRDPSARETVVQPGERITIAGCPAHVETRPHQTDRPSPWTLLDPRFHGPISHTQPLQPLPQPE